MNSLKVVSLIALWIVSSITICLSQDIKAEYSSAVSELKTLKNRQDSTQNQIDRNRQLLENRPDQKDAYSKAIVTLEDQLYEINSKISKVSAIILSLESQLPRNEQTSQSSNTTATADISKESRNLFENYFFITNIPRNDLSKINKTSAAEAKTIALTRSIELLYAEMEAMKERYDNAQSQKEIEDMLKEAAQIQERIEVADSEIESVWGSIYNLKADTYLILVDKLSGIDRLQLEQIDNDLRAVRRAESLAEGQAAPNTVLFPLQKELVLHYEQMLATNLELKLAQDSISKQLSALPKTKLNLPRIVFEPRSLVVYSAVTMDGKYGYTSVDSIPEIIVPTKGVYYSVQVATMATKPTSLSFFRGGKPLHLVRLSNGQLQYVLGGFKTHAETQSCVNQLYKAGYRGPSIVAWVDGVYTPALKAKAAEEAIDKANAGRFKIEIRTRNSALSSSLREIVDMHSADKQISRVQDGSDLIFTIFQFANKEEAEVIAEIIRTKENTKVEVIAIGDKVENIK